MVEMESVPYTVYLLICLQFLKLVIYLSFVVSIHHFAPPDPCYFNAAVNGYLERTLLKGAEDSTPPRRRSFT